jgi:hypothetical protein
MIEQPCIIILDQPDPAERQAVHDLIKENSSGWWHHFPDVWIAGGQPVTAWRDMIASQTPGKVMVLALPDATQERNWAMSFMEQSSASDSLGGPLAWLTFIYSGRNVDETPVIRRGIMPKTTEPESLSDEPPF